MDLGLKNKNAAITGSSQGIGLALAKYWAKKCGKVVLGDVSADGLEKVVPRCLPG